MAHEFDPIDKWFEKGFRVRRQAAIQSREAIRKNALRSSRAKEKVNPSKGITPQKNPGSSKADNTASVIKKSPEVMVKITGSNNGLIAAKKHIDYISRNGKVELENERGETLRGKSDLKDWAQQMKASQVPAVGKKREFLHVVFSMPADTPKDEMREAVKEFCKNEFKNHSYVMAYHDDTKHKHVHVCVSTRDIDRIEAPRLSPRKSDLFQWRTKFAENLRDLGVEAAASTRKTRFNYRKPEKFPIRQMRAENPNSSVFNQRRADDLEIREKIRQSKNPSYSSGKTGKSPRTPKVMQDQARELKEALKAQKRPINPAQTALEQAQKETLRAWFNVQQNLLKSGNKELANEVANLLEEGRKPIKSKSQDLYDSLVARNKEQQKDVRDI